MQRGGKLLQLNQVNYLSISNLMLYIYIYINLHALILLDIHASITKVVKGAYRNTDIFPKESHDSLLI